MSDDTDETDERDQADEGKESERDTLESVRDGVEVRPTVRVRDTDEIAGGETGSVSPRDPDDEPADRENEGDDRGCSVSADHAAEGTSNTAKAQQIAHGSLRAHASTRGPRSRLPEPRGRGRCHSES